MQLTAADGAHPQNSRFLRHLTGAVPLWIRFVRQVVEGKPQLKVLRAKFRQYVMSSVSNLMNEQQLLGALDVTRVRSIEHASLHRGLFASFHLCSSCAFLINGDLIWVHSYFAHWILETKADGTDRLCSDGVFSFPTWIPCWLHADLPPVSVSVSTHMPAHRFWAPNSNSLALPLRT